MLPRKKLEILNLQTARNALKLLNPTTIMYFESFKIFYDPIRRTFLAPGGRGGGAACAPRASPLPTGLGT